MGREIEIGETGVGRMMGRNLEDFRGWKGYDQHTKKIKIQKYNQSLNQVQRIYNSEDIPDKLPK